LDEFALATLGLSKPNPNSGHIAHAIRRGDAAAAGKLFPDYFHPERIHAVRSVAAAFPGDRSAKLSKIVDFVRRQRRVDASDFYLGLANIQPNTGAWVRNNEDDGEGTAFEYEAGDVLFARLRPYLNKVYRAENDGVCSTEFHVMRPRRSSKARQAVLPDYLAAVLRSSIVLAQTRHMMTGNTHPRLANGDVDDLVVPIPGIAVQQRIADEAARRRVEARRLRAEAQAAWETAKRVFEEALLGPVPAAIDGGAR
jgi:type I restriction enzyme S subunit